MQQLSLPDTLLLQSSQSEGADSDEARLEADLSCGLDLYMDLQNKYNMFYNFS